MIPLLQVCNLSVHFPLRKAIFSSSSPALVYAVDGVSFQIHKGEVLGIVGESGCGKTTVALTLVQLVEPTTGEINFQGKNLRKMNPSEALSVKKKIQIILQDPFSSLNGRMRIERILADPLDAHGIRNKCEIQEKSRHILERVGLSTDSLKRYPHEFSGGQRQRIAIARALIIEPELVIADEPVSALDVSIRAQIINLLMDLKREFALSLIVIAHDLAVIEHMADWIAVMYLGKIVELGQAELICASPRHPYTQALIASIPGLQSASIQKRSAIEGDIPSPITPPLGCRFHPRCKQKQSCCTERNPELRELFPNQHVACHLFP